MSFEEVHAAATTSSEASHLLAKLRDGLDCKEAIAQELLNLVQTCHSNAELREAASIMPELSSVTSQIEDSESCKARTKQACQVINPFIQPRLHSESHTQPQAKSFHLALKFSSAALSASDLAPPGTLLTSSPSLASIPNLTSSLGLTSTLFQVIDLLFDHVGGDQQPPELWEIATKRAPTSWPPDARLTVELVAQAVELTCETASICAQRASPGNGGSVADASAPRPSTPSPEVTDGLNADLHVCNLLLPLLHRALAALRYVVRCAHITSMVYACLHLPEDSSVSAMPPPVPHLAALRSGPIFLEEESRVASRSKVCCGGELRPLH